MQQRADRYPGGQILQGDDLRSLFVLWKSCGGQDGLWRFNTGARWRFNYDSTDLREERDPADSIEEKLTPVIVASTEFPDDGVSGPWPGVRLEEGRVVKLEIYDRELQGPLTPNPNHPGHPLQP